MSVLRRAWLWLPPLAYMALIFHFSSESNPMPSVTAIVWDKALHAIEYAGLAVLVSRALRSEGLGWLAAIVLTVLLASAYGATDEWHQSFVPGRDSDVHDWLADTVGGVIGATAYAELMKGYVRWKTRITAPK